MNTTKHLTMQIKNSVGSLARITGMIRREGWNIKSLTAAPSLTHPVSRADILVEGPESGFERLFAKILRFDCNYDIMVSEKEITRELVLAKLEVAENLPDNTRIISQNVVEFTGTPQEVDEWLDNIRQNGVIEMSRSGLIAL